MQFKSVIVLLAAVLVSVVLAEKSTSTMVDEASERVTSNATNVTRPLSQPSNPNSMVWLRLFPSSYGDFFNLAVFLVETKRYHRVRTTVRRLNNKVDSLEAKINRILKWTQQQPQQLPQQLSQQQLSRQQIRGLFQLRKRR